MRIVIALFVLAFFVSGCDSLGAKKRSVAADTCKAKGQEIEFMVAADDMVTMRCTDKH